MSHIIIKTDVTTALATFRKDSPAPLGEDSGYDDLFAQILCGSSDAKFYIDTLSENFPDLPGSEITTRFSRRIFQRLLQNARMRQYNLQEYFNLTDTKNKFAAGDRAEDIELAIQHVLRTNLKFNEAFQDIINAETVTADPSPRHFEIARYLIESILQLTNNTISIVRNSSPHEIHANINSLRSDAPSLSSLTEGLQITGLILSGINFIFIPVYYLICKLQGKEVPFNFHNNLKWAYSAISLTLGLISYLVPPVGLSILIAYAAAVGAYSVISLGKTVYDRIQLKRNVHDNQLTIQIREEQIQYDVIKAEIIKKEFDDESQKEFPDPDKLDNLSLQLESVQDQHQKHCNDLRQARNTELFLQTEIYKSKSIARPVINLTYLLLAATFVTGVILLFNPVTAPIAGIILTVGAIATVANHILNKTHQAWERPRINKILSCENQKGEIELSQIKITTSLRQSHQMQIAKQQAQQTLPSPSVKFAAPGSKLKNPFFARPESQRHSIPLQDQSQLLLSMRA